MSEDPGHPIRTPPPLEGSVRLWRREFRVAALGVDVSFGAAVLTDLAPQDVEEITEEVMEVMQPTTEVPRLGPGASRSDEPGAVDDSGS